jgi:hypothetical protein
MRTSSTYRYIICNRGYIVRHNRRARKEERHEALQLQEF